LKDVEIESKEVKKFGSRAGGVERKIERKKWAKQ
jgi:hypothetical protein